MTLLVALIFTPPTANRLLAVFASGFSMALPSLNAFAAKKNIAKHFFLLKKLPKVPKYPKTNDLNLDLPEELGKEEKMIAGFISNYAMTSPSEFIAETFSALCERPIEEFSDDIINLYKKYKGPMLEFFENNTI